MKDGANLPTIVVPCFNEETRLDETSFLRLAESDRLRLLFVDDGSTDRTGSLLHGLASRSASIDALSLPGNVGKSEAVRAGLVKATAQRTDVVGYFDADLATPTGELLRLLTIMESQTELAAVFGSRVAMLGSDIERSNGRHYLGRFYATVASLALGIHVYDTQCGAKLFRPSPAFLDAIARPFTTKWAFDVELLGRLLEGTSTSSGIPVDSILEVPLRSWRDVEGTHLRLSDGFTALVDVITIGLRRRSVGK